MRTEPPAGNPQWVVYNPAQPHKLPNELPARTKLAQRILCRASLGDFVIAAWHVLEVGTPLKWNWHLDVLCDHIQAVLEEQIPLKLGETRSATMPRTGLKRASCQNLLINVPPGTMKSLILNVFAVAWMWDRHPAWRVICSSGNESVALRDSVRCRDLLKSEWYTQLFEPTWTFSADSDGKTMFKNSANGVRLVRTAGQNVTGDRGDAIFVDDPNDAQAVRTEAHRQKINVAWWSDTISNRVNDPATSVRIIIMQRLHEEDLTGHILERNKLRKDGGEWEQLCIPMEYEGAANGDKGTGTFLGWIDPRKVEGELLMPHRFPAAYVKAEKVEKGSAVYAGQYQQRPAPKEGNKFKRDWWRFWRLDGGPLVQPNRPKDAYQGAAVVLPSRTDWEDSCESWDLTFKGKESNDWVVGVKALKVGADRYILRLWRKHTGFGGACAGIIELRSALPRIEGPVLIEDKANGPAVMEELSKVVPGLIAVNPKDGKEQRAAVMEPQVEAGNWYLPDGENWVEDFIDEFAVFPNGKHDDQVDAVSQACARFGQDSELEQARILFGLK